MPVDVLRAAHYSHVFVCVSAMRWVSVCVCVCLCTHNSHAKCEKRTEEKWTRLGNLCVCFDLWKPNTRTSIVQAIRSILCVNFFCCCCMFLSTECRTLRTMWGLPVCHWTNGIGKKLVDYKMPVQCSKFPFAMHATYTLLEEQFRKIRF